MSINNFTTKLEPYTKITKKFIKKFGSKVNRQYFHRKTRLKSLLSEYIYCTVTPLFGMTRNAPVVHCAAATAASVNPFPTKKESGVAPVALRASLTV